jgi:dTDP-4-amino-4,6-dideoxygalactose transaminase
MRFKVPYSGISNRLGLEEAEMVLKALQQDSLCLGPMNAEFEKRFSEYLGANQIQLPMYDHLTEDQIDHMIGAVRRAVEKLRGGSYYVSPT